MWPTVDLCRKLKLLLFEGPLAASKSLVIMLLKAESKVYVEASAEERAVEKIYSLAVAK
jgi:hypothetical protein